MRDSCARRRRAIRTRDARERSGPPFYTFSRYDDRDRARRAAHDSSQEVDDMTDDRNVESATSWTWWCARKCAAPAEVVDRFALPSTDGPVDTSRWRA
jgi:hypothetical protein